MGKLDGKVAIVTGSGQGIGRGLALALAKEGAKLVIAEINPTTGASVAEEIRGLDRDAISVVCDVSDKAQVDSMVQRAVDEFGTVDVLINNAQQLFLQYESVEDMREERWARTFETGLMGTWYCSRAVFPHMKDRGGKIINFGSGWGILGAEGWSDYAACKEAIRGLTRSAAREWGKYKITVNVICPGLRSPSADEFLRREMEKATHSNTGSTETAIENMQGTNGALGYFGDPEESGGPVAVFLASADSDYMTGQTFHVDGGTIITA